MKNTLFAFVVLTVLSLPAAAQSVSAEVSTASIGANSKQLLASKIVEINASLSRNVPELTKKLYNDAAAIMQQSIAVNREAAAKASSSELARLKKLVTVQDNLYSEAKILSVDVKKNQKDLLAKLEAFKDTL